jgi:hypothetical protein
MGMAIERRHTIAAAQTTDFQAKAVICLQKPLHKQKASYGAGLTFACRMSETVH